MATSSLRRDIPDLAIPVNILLLVWMIIGRALFGSFGWMTILGVLASPVLVICLAITSVMMRRPRGRELTAAQVRTQIVLWSAMFVFGVACLDGGDSGSSDSVLTKLARGWPPMYDISGVLWWGSCIVGFVAWVVLVWSLSARSAKAPLPQPPFLDPGTDPSR